MDYSNQYSASRGGAQADRSANIAGASFVVNEPLANIICTAIISVTVLIMYFGR